MNKNSRDTVQTRRETKNGNEDAQAVTIKIDRSPVSEARRDRGRQAIERAGGSAVVARLMGQASPSTLSQVFGPNPTRNPTDKLMRKIEQALSLPRMSLDTDSPHLTAEPTTPVVGVETVATVVRIVGEVLASERLVLDPKRFADVVALVYSDTMEHGGKPREGHIRSVVRLLK